MTRQLLSCLAALLLPALLAGCGKPDAAAENLPQEPETHALYSDDSLRESPCPEEEKENSMVDLILRIGNMDLPVEWENNESVAALGALAAESPLTVELSPYGGFEQVGRLGTSLPNDDLPLVTAPGDIVLYSGDQIVLFYGSNSWSYTKLGKITGLDQDELTQLLGGEAVTLVITTAGEETP